ncbi:MAG TPA: FAD-binding oxidoreductase, partial [Candidatus Lustribacter sp.]|nr:FAD-binding oxidoreductase [Candidatus Lustribacter sp.]
HAQAVTEVARQFAGLDPDTPVRLAKRTSNLFRPRAAPSAPGLDVSGLDSVVEVDVVARTATVQGMATYEHVVDATLAHGLMPLVVPQLKTITVGGAVTGLGIESSSFRNGLPHESVRAMEVLTGSGEVVTAYPQGPYADLYRAFPNSYGSLGYAMSLVIELEPVQPYVRLRHVRFSGLGPLVEAIGRVMTAHAYEGTPVDFIDGVVFGRHEAYLTLGTWAGGLDAAERPSDYTGQDIYYRSIQRLGRDVLTVRDYLWRWDTDWFWCSRAFGAQHPLLRRVWPRQWLRSDVYSTIVGVENRHGWAARVDRLRGRPARERVVQDVELALDRTADFLDWFLAEVPIEPVWLCPVQLRTEWPRAAGVGDERTEPPWPLYPMAPSVPYVNVGFWSTVPVAPGHADGDVNREIERVVGELGGHKSLYSDSYYGREAFLAKYGGTTYAKVKRRYDPQGRFPELYDKAVRGR